MHNMEITHIVKTNSLSKKSIGCKDQVFFCCHFRETYVKTKKRRTIFM